MPSEIKKELQLDKKVLSKMNAYEVAFHRYNFLHLTGVRIKNSKIASAIHFYEKCLGNRLMESDFSFTSDGSSVQKLDVLEDMMNLKKTITMIGDFTDRGPKLYSEKIAGNICGCIGFVKDKNTGLNVPNTLLKKDIRDVTAIPTQKVYGIFSKGYNDEVYCVIEKLDKSINLREHKFTEEIKQKIGDWNESK